MENDTGKHVLAKRVVVALAVAGGDLKAQTHRQHKLGHADAKAAEEGIEGKIAHHHHVDELQHPERHQERQKRVDHLEPRRQRGHVVLVGLAKRQRHLGQLFQRQRARRLGVFRQLRRLGRLFGRGSGLGHGVGMVFGGSANFRGSMTGTVARQKPSLN